MDLEVLVGRSLFLAVPVELGQQFVEVFGTAAVHPAVVAGGPAQCGIGMPTDQDRDRLGGSRRHLGLGDVVELAVELEVFAGGQAADDLDALVHPFAALGERHTHQLVILRPRTGADAEADAVADQRDQRAGLLGHQCGRADGEFEDEEVEVQGGGHRAERGRDHKRLDERLTVEELPVAVGGVGVFGVGLERIGDAVGDRHRVVAGRLSGFGQRNVVARIGHRFGVGESHQPILERVLFPWAVSPLLALGLTRRAARDRVAPHRLRAGMPDPVHLHRCCHRRHYYEYGDDG